MALYHVRVTLGRPDEDSVQWGFGFDAPDEPTPLELSNILEAIDLFDLENSTALGLTPMTLDYAEAFPAEGGPAVAVFGTGGDFTVGNGDPGNADVALAVSLHVATPRGGSPRGRVYLGPFNANVTGRARPLAAHQGACRGLVNEVLQAGEANGWEPVVISRREGGSERPTPVGLPIIELSTDNAWDTQRRRGQEPTQRTIENYPIPDD